MWSILVACREPEPRPPGDDDDTTSPYLHTAHTGRQTLGHTGHTGTPGDHTSLVDPCTTLPSSPLSQSAVRIETTEDFDFDGLGRMVYVDWNGNVITVDDSLRPQILSPGDWYSDARGVQVDSEGNILVNYISGGKTVKVDPVTGARTDYIVGLSGPNALEIGPGDVVYLTETGTGRVLRYDPATEEGAVIATGFSYPNGLTLSPDALTLYVSDDSRGIFSLHYDPTSDDWGSPVQVFDPARGEAYDAMETDICGNLYSVQFYSGKLYRFDPVAQDATLLVDLDDPAALLWNAIRWGSNRSIWDRSTLYVTSRNKVFALELGIPGKDQPIDALP